MKCVCLLGARTEPGPPAIAKPFVAVRHSLLNYGAPLRFVVRIQRAVQHRWAAVLRIARERAGAAERAAGQHHGERGEQTAFGNFP